MSNKKTKKYFLSARIPETLDKSITYLSKKYSHFSKNIIVEVALNKFFSQKEDAQVQDIIDQLSGVQTPHK